MKICYVILSSTVTNTLYALVKYYLIPTKNYIIFEVVIQLNIISNIISN